MLFIEHLTVSYQDFVALNDLDLHLSEGKIHGILGPNGAGKTTLLNTIYGFIKPDQGSIQWKERPITTMDIGCLPVENYFYPLIKGREYLELFRLQNPGFKIDKWNELFNLPLNDFIDTYSTGMQKKLALFGIIALNREILMLDEPFTSLDLETGELVKTVLRQLAQNGKTILLTSHILETMTLICDEIHLLNNGSHIQSFHKDGFPAIHDFLFKNADEFTNELVKELLKDH